MAVDDIHFSLTPAGVSGIERQLGEVVGTLRATVHGLETLRLSVERLTERAAFKGDLDGLRAELLAQIDEMKDELRGEISGEKKKVDVIRIWIATAAGVGVAIAFILKFMDFGLRLTLGG